MPDEQVPQASGTEPELEVAPSETDPSSNRPQGHRSPGIIEELLTAILVDGADTPPAVLVANGPEATRIVPPTPEGWPMRLVPNMIELVASTSEELQARPVVLIPPWERGQLRGQFDSYEQVLLDCDPSDAEFPLVTLIPAACLDSQRGESFREQLFTRWHPTVIVYVEGGIEGVHRQFETAILVLRRPEDAAGPVRLFETPRRPTMESSDVIEDFRRLLRMKGGSRDFGYVLQSAPDSRTGLGFRRNDPRIAARRKQLADFGQATRLDEVFEILPLGINQAIAKDHQVDRKFEGATRILTGRDIQRGGRIACDDEASRWSTVEPEARLRAGDIVMRAVHRPTDRPGLVWARVAVEDLPVASSHNVLVLRPREMVEPVVEDFILRFMSSRQATELIDFRTSGLYLNRNDVGALQVPIPDESMCAALESVQYARDRAGEWQSEASELLDSIFDEDTAAVSKNRVLRASRTVRWRIDAAEAISDFGHQIRTRFPHPVAYRWRVAEALLSTGPNADGYRAVLEAAEVLLAYTANVALALAHAAGITAGSIDGIRKKLAAGQGPGMGDWVAVLNEITGKRFTALDERFGIPEIREFFAHSGVRDAQRWLSARRNDEAHHRRVDSIDLPQVCERAVQELLVLMRAAEFIADLPLLLIVSTQWDSLASKGTASYRQLTGDHTVVPQQTMMVTDSVIENKSLYIRDSDHRLHLMRPYLIGRECPTCRNLSIFHVDKINGGIAVLKSLEHGHTVEDPDIFASLSAVGLLP
ncbi:hypothetical protein BKP42_54730 [Rhodococcus erythropolis]|uniref:hypothetical protein n=1 Tax=Rhodococcus erythropolis TaxID=1833 RepID=UPI000BB30B6B|nr:hypothetical protein [Rhodococcus erythropolis]PBI91121.1 hypothetical protein BKP42_54730 [Rhodococcus erythropolis]